MWKWYYFSRRRKKKTTARRRQRVVDVNSWFERGHWRRVCGAEYTLPHKSLNGSVCFTSMKPLKPRHQNISSSPLIYDPLCQPLSTNCARGGYEIFRVWKRQLFVFTCRHVCTRVHAHVFICAFKSCASLSHREARGGAWSPGGVSTGERLPQHPEKLISLSELKIKIKIQSVIIISILIGGLSVWSATQPQ